MIITSTNKVVRHTPSMAPEGSNARVLIRALTGPEKAKVFGNSTDDDEVNQGDLVVAAAMAGVVGLEGFLDEEGHEVKFRRGDPTRLDALPWQLIAEVGTRVILLSRADEEDLGNSESGSPSSQESSPTE